MLKLVLEDENSYSLVMLVNLLFIDLKPCLVIVPLGFNLLFFIVYTV